ncbi:MAG: hypothetical protein WAR79_14085, partial [Melioribacteraceae bacterium]
MDRRKFIQISSLAGTAMVSGVNISYAKNFSKNSLKHLWPICLNTSTIRPTTLEEKINAAQKAGYDGIEIWINELEDYESDGGNLKELGIQIKEKGLFVPNII